MSTEAKFDDLEADVNAVIASCDGDPRAAIRALIVANSYLEAEVERLAAALSVGFTYGKIPASAEGVAPCRASSFIKSRGIQSRFGRSPSGA